MDELEAILYLERGPQPNMRFPLNQDQVVIGRGAGNDIVIVDPEVSRRHARIVRQPHQFAVEDLGSTNGTFVNGQRVSSLTALQDADTIDLGDTVRLRFVLTSLVATPVAPPPPTTAEPAKEAPPKPAPPVSRPAPEPPLVIEPSPVSPKPPYTGVPSAGYTPADYAIPADVYAPPRRGRGLWLGCGLLLALLLVCLGTFLLLDAFDQGRLLYCGQLRPFFQLVLGPVGFAPICP